MKKRFSSVMAILLVVCMLIAQVPATVFAITQTTPTIVVSDAIGAAGSSVEVTVGLENNPGIVSMTLNMTYDAEKLTLTKVEDAGVFGTESHKPELQSPYTLVWVNDTATENYMVEGTIATLTFTIADSLEEDTVIPIEITYDYEDYDIYDKDAQKVEFAIDNGSVTVGEPGPNDISDFDYEISGSNLIIKNYIGTSKVVVIGEKYTVDNVEYTVTEISGYEEKAGKKTYYYGAFQDNTDIEMVSIPATVTKIGDTDSEYYAFYGCTNLKDVYIYGSPDIAEATLGFYYDEEAEADTVVDGTTIYAYADSSAKTYAETSGITFVELEKECNHQGGEATCKELAICSLCNKSYGSLNANNHKNTEVRDDEPASCNAPGYTGDTWCKDCNTKITDGSAIDPTGDHVDADGDWESNDTHHFHTCTCTTQFDSAAHSGGTATCKEKALCSVCGTAYGSLNASNHTGSTYLVGQKEATCYEEGYTGDTYCSDCDVKIATGSTIEKDGHNPASVWSNDETHHWKECNTIGCGNLIDKAEHVGGEATCKNKAVCSVCGVAYGSLDTNNHKNTEVRDAATETCNEPGYTGDTWCLDCNTKIATGTAIDPTGAHIDVDGRWESNGEQHFHTCSCGTEFDKAGHTGGTATCKDKAVCQICGTSYGSKDATNHAGGTEVRGAYAESCNEPGYTGDTYCLGCETKIATGSVIDPNGNHVDADGDWESNDTQHFHTCSCGTEFDKTAHTGGEATCKNKASCSVCGTAYGSLNANNHKGTTYLVGQKEATCYEEGYTGDTHCSDCDVKIATGTSIDKDSHNPASVWTTDETHHWKECTVVACGNIIDKAEHTGGEATCKNKAVCSVCGVAYGSLNANNHKNTEVRDAATETCNEPGYTGDTWCLDCNTKIATGTVIDPNGNHVDANGEWETNGDQHFHTCGCGTEFDKAAHTGGTATCKDKAKCSICNVSYGDKNAANHAGGTEVRGASSETCNEPGYTGDTYCLGCNTKIADGKTIDPNGNHVDADGDWESNDTQHFHTCGCGTEFDKAGHTGGEATCKNKASCSVCGTAYGSLNANNHKGTTYLVGQKEATCYEEGYTGDTHCSDCDVKIATGTSIDKDAHNPASVWTTDETHHWKVCTVVACGNIVDKAEHTGGEATCKNKAVCSVCGVAYGSLNADNHKNTEVRDATTASCNAPGYTGDTWCLDCNTKIATGTSIDPTGNHIDANGEWESNGTQHFHTCGCGTEFDKSGHTGGEATCKVQASCSVCGTAYGELNANNHKGTTYLVGQKEATCYEEGYTGDTHCSDCNVKIATGTSIEKASHNPASVWSTDETHHWKECTVVACGNIIDKAAHSGGEATCTAKAVCSVCNVAYGTTNADNHKNTELRGVVAAECNTPGYTGDTWCLDCNTKIATGTSIDPTGNHIDADNKWESNGKQHFHTCGCGTEFDHANHTGGTATCKDKAVCEICNVSYGELNATNHTGETEIRNAEEAKCNKEGYTGDTYCKGCDTKLANGKKIDKVPHIVKEWTVSKEATTEETGLKTGVCSGCNETMTVETAKLVETIKPENIEGTDVKIEIVGDSNISEDVIFKADEILDSIVEEEKEKVDNAVEDAIEKFDEIKDNVKIGAIFDFSLILRETNTDGDVIGETELELDGKVKVTVVVPEVVINTLENLKLLHIKDDGTVEIVPFTLKDGKATFEATGFSYYTFVGTEKVSGEQGGPSVDDNNGGTTDSPQTGDNSNLILWIAVMFVSASALTVLTVYSKRKKQSR